MSADLRNSALSPDVKSWIDNCVVPILAPQYLAQREAAESNVRKNSVLASEEQSVRQSPQETTPMREEER
jgi:hypothetical protein